MLFLYTDLENINLPFASKTMNEPLSETSFIDLFLLEPLIKACEIIKIVAFCISNFFYN